jgi:hypothetical protein
MGVDIELHSSCWLVNALGTERTDTRGQDMNSNETLSALFAQIDGTVSAADLVADQRKRDGEAAAARLSSTRSAYEGRTIAEVAPDAVVESPKVVAENAKRAKSGRPKMTAKEAREFEMYSEKNAGIVEEAAAERGCECVAYESIFTFNRWIAQGRVVKKGEKATFIEVPNFREVVDEATGKTKKIKVGTRRAAVFCKCQTKKLEARAKAA